MLKKCKIQWVHRIDSLVQERRNSIANALELRLSCTDPLVWRNAGFIREIDRLFTAYWLIYSTSIWFTFGLCAYAALIKAHKHFHEEFRICFFFLFHSKNAFLQLSYPMLIQGLRPANDTVLLCNDVSHWLGASLESALISILWINEAFVET